MLEVLRYPYRGGGYSGGLPARRGLGGKRGHLQYNQLVMGIYETYSKRLKKRERAGEADVYQYDDLPEPLRTQIVHIWVAAIGPHPDMWKFIHDTLAREMGVFHLWGDGRATDFGACKQFLLGAPTLQALDIIELSFYVVRDIREATESSYWSSLKQSPEDAIDELNHRFREHGVGYQFVEGHIVRVDSQYVHAEVVKPAISLLNTAGFEGASDEFLKAHEHYRKGRLGEAMSDALKAFESIMKAICERNGWGYRESDTAKPLINTILDNGLVPKYMETHLAGLRNTLEAGLPTVRNKNSGHGQGLLARKVPDYFAGYALHLAATNIVFLVEAHEALNCK